MADFLVDLRKAKKRRKYKSPDGLISMDCKLNYPRFVLCKKPHKKRSIRGEITFFAKVSKMAISGKVANGGPRENVQKWPTFWSNFGRLKK